MKSSGFTLLEIVTVVAIMGIIAGLAVGPIKSARLRARDAQRKTDIALMAQGVELFLAERKILPGQSEGSCEEFRSDTVSWQSFESLIAAYLPGATRVPNDPLDDGPEYHYTYTCSPTSRTFTLRARLENPNDYEGSLIDPLDRSKGRKFEITR